MDLEKTVKNLVSNEDEIVQTISDIVAYLETTQKRFAHLEGHIGQLSKRPAVIVKPNSKLFLLTACIVSGYLGYKLADRKVQEKLQEMAKQAKEAAEQAAKNAKEQYEQAAKNSKEQQAKRGPDDKSFDGLPTTTN